MIKGFLCFEELETGILYAVISPKNNILPYLAEHYSDRLPMENFLIWDEGRDLYVVHPAGKEWFLLKESEKKNRGEKASDKKEDAHDEERFGALSLEEKYYQELFRHFCHTISIEGRKNLNLQRNMLPLRFRPYMVEFFEK